jgi:hypothetical protein
MCSQARLSLARGRLDRQTMACGRMRGRDDGQAFSLAMRFRTMAKRFRGPFFFCRVNECKATSFKF